MVRLRHLLSGCALAACAAPALAQSPYGQPVAQPGYVNPFAPQSDVDQLAQQMRLVAANPTDLYALLNAARLSLKVGDTDAAAALYTRAERVNPTHPQVKAGMARLLVQSGRPGAALRKFQEAERVGATLADFGPDRALAYDLVGEQQRAQREYRALLRLGADDEVARRYALSLGISGLQEPALALLEPLNRRGDRGAWRARAFVLAMNGDRAGAERIATTMMPPGMAQGLAPFFDRLPRLSAAERAFAVSFGETRASPTRLADARLVPSLPALSPEPNPFPQVRTPVQTAALEDVDDGRRKKKRRQKNKAEPVRVARQPYVAPLPAPPAPTATQLAALSASRTTSRAFMPRPAGGRVTVLPPPADAYRGPTTQVAAAPANPTDRDEPDYAVAAVSALAGGKPAATPTQVARTAPATPPPAAVAPPALAATTPATGATAPLLGTRPASGTSYALAAAPGVTVSPTATAGEASPIAPPAAVVAGTTPIQPGAAVPASVVSATDTAPPPAPGFSGLAVATPAAVPDAGAAPATTDVASVVPATVAPATTTAAITPATGAPPAPLGAGGDDALAAIVAGIKVPDAELTAPITGVPAPVQPSGTRLLANIDAKAAATPAPRPAAKSEPAKPDPTLPKKDARGRFVDDKGKALLDPQGRPMGPKGAAAWQLAQNRKAEADNAPAPNLPRKDARGRFVDAKGKPLLDERGRPLGPKAAAAWQLAQADKTDDAAPAKVKADPTLPKKDARGRFVDDRGKPLLDARGRALTEKAAREWKSEQAKEAAEAKKLAAAAKGEPQRYWVQVAGGANAATLGREWTRVSGATPSLKGKQGWTTPLRATNRILTGPFKSSAEAMTMVNQLKKEGLAAFMFTSDAGQKVTRLGK